MIDVTAALFRTLIEKTENDELEWIDPTEDLYYCDFENYRLVIHNYHPCYHLSNVHKNREEGRPKVTVSIIHHEGNSERDYERALKDEIVHQRAEIDTSKHPRYKLLADHLYAVINGGGGTLEVSEQDLIEQLVTDLKG